MRTRLIRLVLAGVLAIATVVWGVAQRRHTVEVVALREAALADADALLALEEQAHSPRTWRALARTSWRTMFPPNFTLAEAAQREALVRDPMSSVPWMELGYQRLFEGRDDEARAALERSDLLDPYYPRERLKSISLWALLDVPEVAIARAQSFATIGASYRADAARELVQAGFEPEEAMDALMVDDLTPADRVMLARAVAPESGPQRRVVLESVLPDVVQDAAARLAMAELVLQPLSLDLVSSLWAIDAGETLGHDGLLVANGDLRLPPFESGFPLGWRALPSNAPGEVVWVSGDDTETPRLRWQVARHQRRDVHWSYYRTAQSADESGVLVTLRARQNIERPGPVRFVARVDRDVIGRADLDPASVDWQDVQFWIPATDTDRVLVLAIHATTNAAEFGAEPLVIEITDLRAERATAEEDEP